MMADGAVSYRINRGGDRQSNRPSVPPSSPLIAIARPRRTCLSVRDWNTRDSKEERDAKQLNQERTSRLLCS